jgi:hypothetical protein
MLNAGVVDENVEASTFRSDVRDRAAGGVCVSDIEGQCDDVIALPVNRPIASLRPGRGRALTATVAPRAASASDIAKPSPREAPVTIATRSTREKGSSNCRDLPSDQLTRLYVRRGARASRARLTRGKTIARIRAGKLETGSLIAAEPSSTF